MARARRGRFKLANLGWNMASLLTLTYSIVQGNVGTAYRQRAQLLVFYFIFVGVGFVLLKERRAAQRHKKELEREAVGRRRQRPKPGKERIPAVG